MKSNVRLTKQGLPDLNYYGPKRTPTAPAAATPAIGSDAPVLAPVEAAEAVATVEPVAPPAV